MSSSQEPRTPRRRAHYVVSTHWDREWHETFQDFRYRLVGLLDLVLDRLESGALRGPFTCDGQAIILEDYLEIRPERTEQVRRFLADGRLVAGPWYVLPDEFLVSGEALIRNIRYGREITRAYGGVPSDAGFVCDLFGHISQLPQIFHGFGLSGALVWRGVEPRPDARFHWIGADGTSIPTLRFGKSGYCDYGFKVRHIIEHGVEFDAEKSRLELRAFLDEEASRTGGQGPLIIFDGGDHLSQDQDHYRTLQEAGEDPSYPYEIVHSNLDVFIGEMTASFRDVGAEIRGELREVAIVPSDEDHQWLIPGVGSSRVWIKQLNAECQNLLCQWAEPFSVFATALLGREYPTTYLEQAWRWLLQNHPHDSICGCSIDQVHEDMKYRFSQSSQIANRLTDEALKAISANISGTVGERELRVTVFNPLPRARREVVEITLAIPAEWPCFTEFFGFESKPAFRIYDADGHELPYQRISQKPNSVRKRVRDIKFPETIAVTEVTVALSLSLPALGYTTLLVRGDTEADAKTPVMTRPTRHPAAQGIAISDHELENEFLQVSVETNGSLTVLDKRSGETYRRLLVFEDAADIGDGWYHGVSTNDQSFTSQGCAANIAIITNGLSVATLCVQVTMKVPQDFDQARTVRSSHRVDLVLESRLTLRSGQDFVEVETDVVNTARDHRVRVLFPSGATETSTFLADSPFDVVERPIALRSDIHTYRELEVESKPQQAWTAVYQNNRGLAIVCDGGLLESGVRDTPQRPIILTLFRSTSRTVMTAGEPGGQLLGHSLRFRYRIVPLAGAPDRALIFDHAQTLSGGHRVVQFDAHDIRVRSSKTTLPSSGSLLEIKGPHVLTSLRQVRNTVETRTFNPNETSERASFDFNPFVRTDSVCAVDFESRPIGANGADISSSLVVTLAPKKISTLRMDVVHESA
jgi:alpha-mannosidase/mannosylglycerate hydrolase